MKKLSEEHYIVTDDSEIKEDSICCNLAHRVIVKPTDLYWANSNKENLKVITHSTQPESLGVGWMQSVQPLLLSEVKELLGVVDVEKKAEGSNGYALYGKPNGEKYLAFREGFIVGYNQALEDNKEKKYTEEDMRKAMVLYSAWITGGAPSLRVAETAEQRIEQIVQSLQPTEWEVEFIDGKLKLKS